MAGEVFIFGAGGSGGGGAGGSELTIVGGTTRPAKATQNMIWIDTDVEITNYILSAAEPEEPVEHMVWITIRTDAPIKVASPVGGDWITVYPISAQQCINGEWIVKDTKNYQDGVWVEWLPEGTLYWYGNECEHLTGGWTSKKWTMQNDAGTAAQTFEIVRNADHMMFTKTGLIGAVMYATNSIDLTNVKAIHFKGEMYPATNKRWCRFLVWTKMGGTYWDTNAAAFIEPAAKTVTTEFTLDVSALSGSYYVGFGIYGSDNYVKVEELYMEVE